MQQKSEHLRQNAENCADLADHAIDAQEKARFKRMEKAWGNLADTQAWLDGEKFNQPERQK